jgi:hypothetical protein
LLDDGVTPRFRQVLVLVSRQNGKTEVLVILSLFWMYVEAVNLILGTSTNLDYARESWDKAVQAGRGQPELFKDVHPKSGIRRANGEQTLTVSVRRALQDRRVQRPRWPLAHHRPADHGRAARAPRLERLQRSRPCNLGRPDAQIWMITNQGDEKSVVLQSLRTQALDNRTHASASSSGPHRMAPCLPTSSALAMANPNLGHRISLESLMGDAMRAEAAGGDQLAGFLTEHQCRYVPMLARRLTPELGQPASTPTPSTPRGRVALCLDVAPDMNHATLYAAGLLDDGRARVEPIAAWSGHGCTDQLRRELPGLIAKVKPAKLGWFPSGPAAALAADMKERDGWPPDGVEVEEIRGDVAAVCMGFAEQVTAREDRAFRRPAARCTYRRRREADARRRLAVQP